MTVLPIVPAYHPKEGSNNLDGNIFLSWEQAMV